MQKIIEETNAVTWFEIPVIDTSRAKKFYETILDMVMQTQYMEETKEEVTFFPFTPNIPRATSGRVSGVLVKNERVRPSGTGITVYLNANPKIKTVLDKIEHAGGKIIMPDKKIAVGHVAIFIDTEGNRVGLYSEN